MRVTLKIGGEARAVTPIDGQPYAFAAGTCPGCGIGYMTTRGAAFKVAGRRRRIAADDRAYEADGECCDCGAGVGLLRAELETFFGLREDEAVIKHARARVYGD